MNAARPRRFVSYLRVSTAKQGQSGLGLEAQREACRAYLAGVPGAILHGEHIEVESGKANDRPKLAAAIAEARAYGAILLIAKLDRLSRDAHFLIGLERSGVEFRACDNPQANRLTIGILALVAEQEREAISARTKAALKAAKARGVKLGNPNGAAHLKGRGNAEAAQAVHVQADAFAAKLAPILAEFSGQSATATAAALNSRGVPSARGRSWTARSVLNLKARLPATLAPSQ
ncbi:recombinase family protein [Methylocella sp.]|uniref:recombinase family protein n=1 Tax=Methylocella sp. TaxID=1978226 RepID=UPI0035B07FAC